MRTALLILLVALPGCDGLFGLRHHYYEPDEQHPDATISVGIDAPTVCAAGFTRYGSYGPNGTGLLALCVPNASSTSVFLSGPFDTDSPECNAVAVADTAGTTLCIRWATNLTIGPMFTATGTRPLVLLATQVLHVMGTLDVSSTLGDENRTRIAGAGANWSQCVLTDGSDDPTAASGGAGGSFGTKGGDSGVSKTGQHANAEPSSPGDRIRGGCPGGKGGTSGSMVGLSAVGGPAGPGGGAVYLIAGAVIQIDAGTTINASGGGGGGGQDTSTAAIAGGGGGGGGAGGMIGLDSPTVLIATDAMLMANGGGGGAAGGTFQNGLPGEDPMKFDQKANGGLGASDMGDGGDGAIHTRTGSNGGGGDASGGGGGGVGYIRIFTTGPVGAYDGSPPAS